MSQSLIIRTIPSTRIVLIPAYIGAIEVVSEIILSERLKRAYVKRERLHCLKMATNRGVFPLYRRGRMVVEHPGYDKKGA